VTLGFYQPLMFSCVNMSKKSPLNTKWTVILLHLLKPLCAGDMAHCLFCSLGDARGYSLELIRPQTGGDRPGNTIPPGYRCVTSRSRRFDYRPGLKRDEAEGVEEIPAKAWLRFMQHHNQP